MGSYFPYLTFLLERTDGMNLTRWDRLGHIWFVLGQLVRSDYIVLKNMFDVVDEELAR